MREVAIVRNPISGSRSRRDPVAAFRRRLEEAGLSVRVRTTEAAGAGAELAREEAAAGTDVLVAAGGDGTVNEVASGLVAAGVTPTVLGILPRGTSNLVARDLGIPLRPESAADVIVHGRSAPMDAGEAGGRLFVACASAGWDAQVVRVLAERRRGHIRFHSYTVPILRTLAAYDLPPVRLISAKGEVAEGVVAIVLNTRPYAAFFRPAPNASPADGLLDGVVLAAKPGWRLAPRLARWAVRGVRGTLDRDVNVTVLRSTGFRFESDAEVPVQIDGDVGGVTPVDMLVRPAALRVMRPAEPGSRPTPEDT